VLLNGGPLFKGKSIGGNVTMGGKLFAGALGYQARA
jgi:hypothetical protein